MSTSHPVFVPAGLQGSRRDTAVVLVGTAREFGIHQSAIKRTATGYDITTELADVLYDEGVLKKTSGNRAEKKNSQKGKNHEH